MANLVDIVAVLLLAGSNCQLVAPVASQPECSYWTDWFDWDNPSGSGDVESVLILQRLYPGRICRDLVPGAIEAVTVPSGIPADSTGQRFLVFSPRGGLVCLNREQERKRKKRRKCYDYKVRFGCACIIDPYGG